MGQIASQPAILILLLVLADSESLKKYPIFHPKKTQNGTKLLAEQMAERKYRVSYGRRL
jgi:hypothetical protein